jgi:hypothetical protein
LYTGTHRRVHASYGWVLSLASSARTTAARFDANIRRNAMPASNSSFVVFLPIGVCRVSNEVGPRHYLLIQPAVRRVGVRFEHLEVEVKKIGMLEDALDQDVVVRALHD